MIYKDIPYKVVINEAS
ncbi:MAG: hypothetical protein ACLTXR_08970 [Clostridia bacterium]